MKTSARRMEMYSAGMNDCEMAQALGVHRTTIREWRVKQGLPMRFEKGPLSPEQNAIRRLLYDLGWSDFHIARHADRSPNAIVNWRIANGLPANFKQGYREHDCPRPTIVDLVEKCRRAVGRYLPRDIAEDAVADIMLDVMTGKLALDKIGASAKRYGNRVIAAFASKWGDRSLDAEMSDEDGFTLLDTIADGSASSWLEEMGATVW